MSQITTCPHCSSRLRVSDQITDKTLICPRCLADVDNPQARLQVQAADINTDVRRGLSVVSIALAVLIGLCVVGIAIALLTPENPNSWGGRIDKLGSTQIDFLMLSFATLDVLVSIAIIRALVRWKISGSRVPSAGRMLGIAFLSIGTIAAVVIFFFFTCLFFII